MSAVTEAAVCVDCGEPRRRDPRGGRHSGWNGTHGRCLTCTSRARRGRVATTSAEVFALTCGHTVLFPQPAPAYGDVVWCVRCGDRSVVEGRLGDGAAR